MASASDLENAPAGEAVDNHAETTADRLAEEQYQLELFQGGRLATNLLRVCVARTWYQKLVVKKLPFDTNTMIGPWLEAGMRVFNKSVPEWTESVPSLRPILIDFMLPFIRPLAMGWLRNMNGKLKKNKESIPDTVPNFANDLRWEFSVSHLRKQHERFYNFHINKVRSEYEKQEKARKKNGQAAEREVPVSVPVVPVQLQPPVEQEFVIHCPPIDSGELSPLTSPTYEEIDNEEEEEFDYDEEDVDEEFDYDDDDGDDDNEESEDEESDDDSILEYFSDEDFIDMLEIRRKKYLRRGQLSSLDESMMLLLCSFDKAYVYASLMEYLQREDEINRRIDALRRRRAERRRLEYERLHEEAVAIDKAIKLKRAALKRAALKRKQSEEDADASQPLKRSRENASMVKPQKLDFGDEDV